MSATDEMPKKVRELMDLHGPGIPHYSCSGRYAVNVYPHQEELGDGSVWSWKEVMVVDTKSNHTWSERLNEHQFLPPRRRRLLARLLGH